MSALLYLFRLRGGGGLVITTDQAGSRLPIDEQLDYKQGDWELLETFPGSELSSMLSSHRQATDALSDWGYFSISPREVIATHPIIRRHQAQ